MTLEKGRSNTKKDKKATKAKVTETKAKGGTKRSVVATSNGEAGKRVKSKDNNDGNCT